MMMKWEQLLSLKKYGDNQPRIRKEQDPTRSGFEVDYDRIIFSSAFRMLQDKTQVIPFSKTDFVHNRLTHSLEVSVVGRSLGRRAGQYILKKHSYLQELGYESNDFGAIVAAAALAHDIGNPPFGHSGEKAIGEYFLNGKGKIFEKDINVKQFQDLAFFEGNANGLMVLCSSLFGEEGGLRISYATLGAFMKYPKESLPIRPTKNIADKKFGFFQTEKEFIEDLAQELGLLSNKGPGYVGYERHPLAYLVEAADDICYTIIDFEDGINLGLIEERYALEYTEEMLKENFRDKYNKLKAREERVGYLRALAIKTLIEDALRVFCENEEDLLRGNFPIALTDRSHFKPKLDDIIKICVDKIYRSPEVIQKEVTGYKVISVLLDTFITAYNNEASGKASNYDKLVLNMLPEKYLTNISKDLYERLLKICHFVSLLTDSNALRLYQVIQGSK